MDLALFDFDGTITTRETFAGFVRAGASRRRRWLGGAALAPHYLGYKLGWLSGEQVRRRVVAVALRGRREDAVRAAAARHLDEVVSAQIRPQARARIDWHRERGDRVVVVTANLDLFVARWCEQQGLECIGSRLESRDGVLTGRYLGRDCCGEEKPRRVREAIALDGYGCVYAYGDTPEDRALLALADRRFYRWREVE
ncbi:HAD family hydrolase [Lysobacter enzymogenes]|uniref:HAD family hydrolase n=1 Tax=Lysobacter enzymogenes TaxID=69 RepID=A0A3N2RGW6_LYSEN|nr:HAD family hydrolase [Lysobacter enzymogenes]ROU06566.1 HAD family hydrolase [Lysobacter enzymogenes]